MKSATKLWMVVKKAGADWVEDRAARLGAALSFYAVFSLAPLLLISIAVAGLVFGQEAVEGELVEQMRGLVGEEGGAAIQTMVASAHRPETGAFATVVGVVLLLFGAGGFFGQLQDALNTIWEVQPKPGRGIWGMIRTRFLSLSMVMGCALLLLVSLVVSAALAAVSRLFGEWHIALLGEVVNFAISFAVITSLFAMIYKFLPDARIAWRDVWLGAAVTSLLFNIGKVLIGLYLGHSSIASSFGAAGSLAVLLMWLYYSSQIFLFGAEFTKAYADHLGEDITPKEYAVRLEPKRDSAVLASRP